MNNKILNKKNPLFCWIDAESTGLCLNEVNTLAWQIAMILVQNDEILEKHNLFIKNQ